MQKMPILVVDDEPGIRKLVGAGLKQAGFEVIQASNGEIALQALETSSPQLIILDIGMPKMDGFEVCRRVREWSQTPVIMLSGRDKEAEKVECLGLGADDYVVKPFSMAELMARVEAVLRRTMMAENMPDSPTFVSSDLRVNFPAQQVTVGERQIKLTATEFQLLQQLVVHHGKVLTHRMLLHSVWGVEYGVEKHYLRVYVNRLRSKLGDSTLNPKYIKTVPCVGYLFLNPD